ncbi:MAG: class I SAM-dependent methyltransferase [Planctomycetaceae bacterium]|nr:class I SAM-dependent methyltransferase [Planctomycetaceae bacterium]
MNAQIHDGIPPLFWEEYAEQRWGQYISAIEEKIIRFAHSQLVTPTTALEIGAEGGRWSKLLADLGWRMTCTEIDPVALAVCQQRIPDSRCVLVDLESRDLPCGNNSQDLILAIEVHELVEQSWFVDEVGRVLKDGGIFVGVFQNKHSWRAALNLKSMLQGTMRHYTAGYLPWKRNMMGRGYRFLREEGICWMPFGRRSNSIFVKPATHLEQLLGLRQLTSVSPWIVFAAIKEPARPSDPGASNER